MSTPIEIVLARLDGVTGRSPSWMARCPAHDDHQASLHVTKSQTGACSFIAMRDAVGPTSYRA